jgi:hypothetical protein
LSFLLADPAFEMRDLGLDDLDRVEERVAIGPSPDDVAAISNIAVRFEQRLAPIGDRISECALSPGKLLGQLGPPCSRRRKLALERLGAIGLSFVKHARLLVGVGASALVPQRCRRR